MNRTRGRLVVACLAVIGAAIAVAGGSAGNRTGVATFDAVPGPGAVTYEENIAYKATFLWTGGSAATHVEFRQTRPVATFGGVDYPATLVAATCDAAFQGNDLVCAFGKLSAGAPPVEVTVVWRAPTIPSPSGCPSCLETNGRFLVKEGVKTDDGNDTFPVGGIDVAARLLGGEGTQETLTAGGYELGACTGGGSSLKTNQAVSLANPVATSFCLPAFATTATNLGLATTITELLGNAHQSEVCIAALGENCGDSYIAADFGPSATTFVFTVASAALPKGYKITQVFHNGELLTDETCERTENPECLVSIDLNNKTKIWTIVATSETNGPWNW